MHCMYNLNSSPLQQAKQRHQEQMSRDPNFVGGGVVSKKELDEVMLECDSLKALVVSTASERMSMEKSLQETESELAAALHKVSMTSLTTGHSRDIDLPHYLRAA